MIKSQKNVYYSGNFTTYISDCHPQFTIIENFLSDTVVLKDVKILKKRLLPQSFKVIISLESSNQLTHQWQYKTTQT